MKDEKEEALIAHARSIAQSIGTRANEYARVDAFPWDVFRLLADEGLIGLAFPVEYGGTDQPMRIRVRVMEELCRVDTVAGSFLSGTDLGSRPIVLGASDDLKRRYVPELARGSMQAAFALTERDAGSDAGAISTTATRDGSHYVIRGIKRFITRANVSELFTVFARTDPNEPGARGVSAFLVERDRAGVCVSEPQPKMGWSGSQICEVIFDDARIPSANLLGVEHRGFRLAMATLDRIRLQIAASGLGRAAGALQMALNYTARRRTFGRVIAEHQGARWMLADMATRVEAARALVYDSAQKYDAAEPDATMYASMAKMFATEASMRVTTDAVQLFGGNGYLNEYPVERFMRDAKLGTIMEGATEVHKDIIADRLLAASVPMHPCMP